MKTALYILCLLALSDYSLAQYRGAAIVSTVQNEESNNIPVLKNIALVIGTNEYSAQKEWANLTNPIFDAETIKEVLENDYGYEVTLLTNPKGDDILNSLENLQKKFENGKMGSNTNLLIFIAGHGGWDNFGSGYLVPSDAQNHVQDKFRKTYITHSNLRQIIENINAPHTLLLLDVCFGGTFDQKLSASTYRSANEEESNIDYNELLRRKTKLRSSKYITSGGKEYVPDGRPSQHSPFTREIIRILRAHYEKKQAISFHSLCNGIELLNPEPRAGDFGINDPGSDFLLLPKSVGSNNDQPNISIDLLGIFGLGENIIPTQCLLVGIKNLIAIKHPGIPLSNLAIEISDSNKISPVYPDSNIYYVSSFKPGQAIITVSIINEHGIKTMLSKKTMSSKRCSIPALNVTGQSNGIITIEKLRQVKELNVEDHNGLKGFFQITDFTLSIMEGDQEVQKFESGNYELTQEMKNALTTTVKSGCKLKFDNVNVIGPDGYRRKCEPILLIVK